MLFKKLITLVLVFLLIGTGFLFFTSYVGEVTLIPFCSSDIGTKTPFCSQYVLSRIKQRLNEKEDRLAFKEGERFFMALNKTESINAEHSEYSITGPLWLKDRINGCAKNEDAEYLTKISWGDGTNSGSLLSKHECDERKSRHIYDIFGGRGQSQAPVTIHAAVEMIRVDANGNPVLGIPASFAEQNFYMN